MRGCHFSKNRDVEDNDRNNVEAYLQLLRFFFKKRFELIEINEHDTTFCSVAQKLWRSTKYLWSYRFSL